MIKRIYTTSLLFILFNTLPICVMSDFPKYANCPFVFPIAEPIDGWGTHIFVVDLNQDGLLDFTYLSPTKLYAYDHYGEKLWEASINCRGSNYGTKHGAADIDDDGIMEIVAINDLNQVVVFNGANGTVENTINVSVGPNQEVGHIAVVNFRGIGDRDILVQTVDQSAGGLNYYINRTLIALRMDTQNELWRVEQDNNINNGFYEGYWGAAHGSFQCADIDNDGKDEVIGGNMVDDNGVVIPLDYPAAWVGTISGVFMDHFDVISIGDFRPDRPGLEWILTEEDRAGETDWHTTLMKVTGVVWRKETTLFTTGLDREPQNTAGGNFDTSQPHCEIWVRSRFGGESSQHPWVFDASGSQFSDYAMVNTLPAGFNAQPDYGNNEGLETIWTIDWEGTKKEYIAAKARHYDGNVGVFDAVTGQAVWTTVGITPPVRASAIYVADIAGDGREEIIIYDEADGMMKVYWNTETNTNQPKPNKWNDPLYRRLKQNWNYYSPGSYTYCDYPIISSIGAGEITPGTATITWETDVDSDSQLEYGETDDYGSQTILDSTLTISHTVHLLDLAPNTTYHFRVKSHNEFGKLGISADQTELTTLPLETPVVINTAPHESNKLRLAWTSSPGVINYNVYRDTNAYFVPDRIEGNNRIGTLIIDEDNGLPDIQWTDESDIVGDWLSNYFYLVTAISGFNESDSSKPVGEFDYRLITTPSTDFNEIALPLNMSGITNAADLMAAIPGCNSVARWNSTVQGYDQYIPGIPPTNFGVEMGYPYYVNITSDTVFTLSGEISNPSFNLITTPTTDFNEIMLTLDKILITKASELMADIPGCNSIARWESSIQGYEQYIPGIVFTDFEVRAGYPYYVNVTSDVTWPEGTSLLKGENRTQIVQSHEESHAPHSVWGRIHLDDEDENRKRACFSAHITSRPGDRLTEKSPGCILRNGYWIVQCGSFSNSWKAGDTLQVNFEDENGLFTQRVEVKLTYQPNDESDKPIVKKTGPPPNHSIMKQNIPNPFNPETEIPYQLAEKSQVRVRIYNMIGQVIRKLFDAHQEAGYHTILWDGRDDHDREMPSGIYICTIENRGKLYRLKLTLIR